MEHYFIVLELPGGDELKFKNGKSNTIDFWKNTAQCIAGGNAKIISKRQDTGVSEELRRHLLNIKKFTTFVLVHIQLHANDFLSEKNILKKLSGWFKAPSNELVIDTAHNFQLVTIDM